MRPARPSAVTQICPNCGRVHDVGVYVSGQKLTCSCGIRFEVRRTDVTVPPPNRTPTREVLAASTTKESLKVPKAAVAPGVPPNATAVGGEALNLKSPLPAPRDATGREGELENVSPLPAPRDATGSEGELNNAPPLPKPQDATRIEGELGNASPLPGGATQVEPSMAQGGAVPPPVPSQVALPVAAAAQESADAPFDPTVAPGPKTADPDGTFVRNPGSLQIPGYALLELLGKGGMGEVWRARQLSLDRAVAVKVLPPKLAKDQEFVARFGKESTALASLNHPNISQIIDRGVAGEHYFFVMEYVQGKTLREVMLDGRPAPQQALRWAAQICRAIDYAHQQKIVHRDLKPENILIDGLGNPKVVDFGLAGMRGAEKNLELTATAVAMGTVNYMAPEQRRDAKNVDQRADIYSLGVLVYELLTGELPIGRFKLPSERVKGLDPRVDQVVAAALENDPLSRPERAGLLAEQLEALASGAPATPLPNLETAPARPKALDEKATQVSVLDRSWSGFKVALMVLGGLALFATVLKALPITRASDVPKPLTAAPQGYADTDDTLSTSMTEDGTGNLAMDFEPGTGGALNVHCGQWKLEDGALTVVQWGPATDQSEHPLLVPRAYVSSHYWSSDDVTVEADVQVEDLPSNFPPVAADAQRFGEVSFRIKDLQVSAFAIPGTGMRLGWRYFTPDRLELAGNTARDVETMVEDEMQAPLGRFRVKLRLKAVKNGAVDVTASVNGLVFAHKVLPGLGGQVGKVALGCRNLSCRFDDLKVSGKAAPRPPVKGAEP